MKKLLAILGIGLILAFSNVAYGATFGYETEGGSASSNNNRLSGTIFTLSESGTLTKITANLLIAANNDDNVSQARASIYDASDDSFIANSSEVIVTGGTKANYDFTFNEALTSGTYWLLIMGSNDVDQVSFSFDTDAGVIGSRVSVTYPSFPDPYVPSADNDRKYSIFATYTPDSPTVTTNTTMSNINLSNVIIK